VTPQVTGSKKFFFEKKNQKTFLLWAAWRFQQRGLRTKVFCGAFFQKSDPLRGIMLKC
jgi:hypothetical protein